MSVQWNGKHEGKEAFITLGKVGYYVGSIDNLKLTAHRVIWVMQNGTWPEKGMEIDHINGIRSDNRWCNLRLVTSSQNKMNRPKSPHNTSGYKGVSWNKQANKWLAQIKIDYKNINLGNYDTPEEAYEVYRKMAHKYHGNFSNIGLN